MGELNKVAAVVIFILFHSLGFGNNTDSLINELQHVKDDTAKVDLYYSIIRSAEYSNPKLALNYSHLILVHPLSQEPYYRSRNLINHAKLLKTLGEFDTATSVMLEGIKIAEEIGDLKNQSMGFNSLGLIFKANKIVLVFVH